ncbi:hypothetical protein INQ29_25000, partial [Escherichia coli]|nr:hypothetical protein [Escherichia coli]
WIVPLAAHGTHSFAVELTRYLAAAGGMTAILWAGARWTAARRIQKRAPAKGDRAREFGHSMLSVGIFALWSIATLAMNQA